MKPFYVDQDRPYTFCTNTDTLNKRMGDRATCSYRFKKAEFNGGPHTLSSLKSFLYVLYDKSYNPSFYDFRALITFIDLIAINNNLTLKECVEHAYNEIKDREIKIKNGVAVK